MAMWSTLIKPKPSLGLGQLVLIKFGSIRLCLKCSYICFSKLYACCLAMVNLVADECYVKW